MSATWVVVVAVLIAVAGLALVIGRLVTLRSTLARGAAEWPDVDTSDLGLSGTGPTVLHFSAPWCGPCAGVRRVVDMGGKRRSRAATGESRTQKGRGDGNATHPAASADARRIGRL